MTLSMRYSTRWAPLKRLGRRITIPVGQQSRSNPTVAAARGPDSQQTQSGIVKAIGASAPTDER